MKSVFIGRLRNELVSSTGHCRKLFTMRSLVCLGFAFSLALLQAHAQQKETPMTHHAHGTFAVKVLPLTPAPAPGLSRYSINKEIHGDLEATSVGEMFGGGDPRKGTAGYVAIEVVTGSMAGKHGSFALQHSATMDQSGLRMQVIVVPGSGTEEFTGISGTFTIKIENGQHFYDFDYTLPQQ